MAIDIIYDKRKGIAVFYCNTNCVAFGPGIRDAFREISDNDAYQELWRKYHGVEIPEEPDEMAEDFLHYCLEHHGDPREPRVAEQLSVIRCEWEDHLVARIREEIRVGREREAEEAIEYQRSLADRASTVGEA